MNIPIGFQTKNKSSKHDGSSIQTARLVRRDLFAREAGENKSMYIVIAYLRWEPDDFYTSNRMPLPRVPSRKFYALSAAKQYSDNLIEKLPDAGQ